MKMNVDCVIRLFSGFFLVKITIIDQCDINSDGMLHTPHDTELSKLLTTVNQVLKNYIYIND